MKAELLAYVGGFEESNRIINELKGFSQNPDCLYVKALGQYYKDSLDLSSHFLKDVLSLKPEHTKALELQSKISEHKKVDEKVQAALKDDTVELEAGLEACDQALKVDVDNKNLMSRLYYLKGRVYSKHEKQLEAIDEYSTAVRLNSLNSKAFFSRAKSFMNLELYDEALKDAEVVIRHESGNSSFRQLYSQVKGKYDEYKSADFYKLLGVEKTSSQEEIRKAYRKAALVHHPDRHSSKHEKIKCYHECRFKDIGEAYGVLSDEAKRLLYDKGLLNKSIPTPSPAQGPHFTNISNVAMQNAAFWASVVQQQRQGMGTASAGLAGARPGAAGAGLAAGFAGGRAGASTAGLAGASPFFFVPGGATGASAANFMQHMYSRNPSTAQYRFPQSTFGQNPSAAQFRFSQSSFSQNPYRKY